MNHPTRPQLKAFRKAGLTITVEPSVKRGGPGAVIVPAVWYVRAAGRDLGSYVPGTSSCRAGSYFGPCKNAREALRLFLEAAGVARAGFPVGGLR